MKTDKRGIREWVLRIVILLAGLTIAHFGVTLFLLSDLGADPFNVLVQGLFRTVSGATGISFLTHGRIHILVCALIIAALLLIDRSYIKIGTVLCMILGGPIIDVFSALLNPLIGETPPLFLRIGMLVAGCVILAYGMTIVIKSDAGTGPNDLVAVVISDKTGKKFSIIRILTDAVFIAAGFLLGGTFGAGTLVCMTLVGPVAGFFLPVNEKLVESLLERAGSAA